jgi:hypothetical protein
MDFPRNKMRVVSSHQGNTSEAGWLVLELKGMDLEGVNRLVIDLAHVEQLRGGGEEQADDLERLRRLLGG